MNQLKRLWQAALLIPLLCWIAVVEGLQVRSIGTAQIIQEDTMNISDLLVQFLALGGVAALIAVIINIAKVLGWVQDGTADTWSTGLNLVGLVALFVLKIVAPTVNIPNVDKMASTIAQLLTLILQLFFQFGVSKFAYMTVRGVPLIGKSFSK